MTFLSILANANYEIPIGEPRIECTVIKVLSSKPKFANTAFPKLYDSIYNDNLRSQLFIGGKEHTHLSPKRIFKGNLIEKIEIQSKASKMELEIKGKPISRNGALSINGTKVAEITCH